jgi:pimeloyl-ACP methyl ester carboxylesterase
MQFHSLDCSPCIQGFQIAIDMPGFGQSYKPEKEPDLAGFAEGVLAAVQAIGYSEPVDYVGHHTGMQMFNGYSDMQIWDFVRDVSTRYILLARTIGHVWSIRNLVFSVPSLWCKSIRILSQKHGKQQVQSMAQYLVLAHLSRSLRFL